MLSGNVITRYVTQPATVIGNSIEDYGMSVKSLSDPFGGLKVVENGRDGYIQANDAGVVDPRYDDTLIHKVRTCVVIHQGGIWERVGEYSRRKNIASVGVDNDILWWIKGLIPTIPRTATVKYPRLRLLYCFRGRLCVWLIISDAFHLLCAGVTETVVPIHASPENVYYYLEYNCMKKKRLTIYTYKNVVCENNIKTCECR